jgi:hypothetical protein
MPDGNVAFKLTWVYGPRGPFTGSCTAQGRKYNIEIDRKVWCSDKDSECAKIFRAGNTGALPPDYRPCYEADLFQHWSFGAGIYHTGPRRGLPMSINHVRPGKLGFFTAKRYDMDEADRRVIAGFEIAEVGPEADSDWGFIITSELRSRVRVRDLDRAPRFWRYHQQNGPPRWGTGLFRYLPDAEALRLYETVRAAAKK